MGRIAPYAITDQVRVPRYCGNEGNLSLLADALPSAGKIYRQKKDELVCVESSKERPIEHSEKYPGWDCIFDMPASLSC